MRRLPSPTPIPLLAGDAPVRRLPNLTGFGGRYSDMYPGLRPELRMPAVSNSAQGG